MNLGSESETVEFKKSTGEHKEALQAVSAMLNKHGNGALYFGVKDDGSIIGQDVSDATLRQVASWISDKIEPAVFPTVERLGSDDGLSYIKVAFSGADAPYSADGRYFTCVRTSNKALCHRDYATGIAVEVNVFMDTVQIVSPGLFPEGDLPERHLEGVASEFGLRNPAIARTLFRAGVIEQYGTYIPRIKEACEAAGVRFRFEQTVNSTVVVFERPGSQVTVTEGDSVGGDGATSDTDDTAWSAMLDGLGKSERRATELAAANGSVSTSALAEGAQITKRASSAALKRLAERGLLEWVGKSARDPKQFYRIPSDGHPDS